MATKKTAATVKTAEKPTLIIKPKHFISDIAEVTPDDTSKEEYVPVKKGLETSDIKPSTKSKIQNGYLKPLEETDGDNKKTETKKEEPIETKPETGKSESDTDTVISAKKDSETDKEQQKESENEIDNEAENITPEATITSTQPAIRNPLSETEEKKASDPKQVKKDAADADLEKKKAIDDIIESKKYNLPINKVAKKRSIKVSLLLVLVVVVLALVLIDLMLDSGLIVLGLHIPHTHFFK